MSNSAQVINATGSARIQIGNNYYQAENISIYHGKGRNAIRGKPENKWRQYSPLTNWFIYPEPHNLLDESLTGTTFNAYKNQHTPSCLENTRVDLLGKIDKWMKDNNKKHIFWLQGMAGTGKSTIAMTVARKYHDLGRLGGSCFFSRDFPSTAGKFAVSIAAQLADAVPELQGYIRRAAKSHPRVCDLGLCYQWDLLVIKPLERFLKKNKLLLRRIIIVVDAIDECESEEDIALMIQCLSKATKIQDSPIRVFITSRPESSVRTVFNDIPQDGFQEFTLHDIDDTIINADLTTYYKHRLSMISERFHLEHHLLSAENIRILVKKSSGLFIHAAILCRFIQNGKIFANQRLRKSLTTDYTPLEMEKDLDEIYSAILENTLPRKFDADEEDNTFKSTVGPIVLLSDGISLAGLAALLGRSKDEIIRILRPFFSLLNVPKDENSPIRLIHPSFRDFLLDPARCRNQIFLIDAEVTRRQSSGHGKVVSLT